MGGPGGAVRSDRPRRPSVVVATARSRNSAGETPWSTKGTRSGINPWPGAAVSLLGIGVLAWGSTGTVTALGVVLLAGRGVAWGLYIAAGWPTVDSRVGDPGRFLVLAAVLLVPTDVGAGSGLRVTGAGLAWPGLDGSGDHRLRLRRVMRLSAVPVRRGLGHGAAGDLGAHRPRCDAAVRRGALTAAAAGRCPGPWRDVAGSGTWRRTVGSSGHVEVGDAIKRAVCAS